MEQRTGKNYHLIERIQGGFQRTVRLPYPVDPSQVQARFDDGVLTVTLPKSGTKQGAQPIEVSRGTSQASASASESSDAKPHSSTSGSPRRAARGRPLAVAPQAFHSPRNSASMRYDL